MTNLKTFKNKNFTKRDFECTNIVCCMACNAPDDNWVECSIDELNGLYQLHSIGTISYYGYM